MYFQEKAITMQIMASTPWSAGFHKPGQILLTKAMKPASGARIKRKAMPSAGVAMANGQTSTWREMGEPRNSRSVRSANARAVDMAKPVLAAAKIALLTMEFQ